MEKLKKTIMPIILIFCILMLVPIISNCATTEPRNSVIVGAQSTKKAKLNKTKLVLIKGQKYTLKVSNTKNAVKWTTSKKSVATVNSKGKVTAKKKGTATISAKVGNKTYKCKITVETPKISKTKKKITIFDSSKLSIKGTKQKVKWKSSNTKIATVNSKGKVVAKKLGTVTIKATVGGYKTYKCKVTVVDTKKGKTYTKLKKIIEQYGYFDSDGDKFIEDNYNTSSSYNNIRIYMLKDTLLLVLQTTDDDGNYYYTHVALDKYKKTANVYFESYYSDNDTDEPDNIATAKFNSEKWNDYTLDFIIEQIMFDDDEYYYIIQNLANAALKVLVYHSKVLLNSYNISINDLGFNI